MDIKIRIEQTKPNIAVSLKEVVTVGGGDPYEGEYTITPAIQEQEMLTKNKTMRKNVTIEAIPYYETSNVSGKTVIIGGN